MSSQCLFDPATAEHALTIVEYRSLARGHRRRGCVKPHDCLTILLRSNTGGKGRVTITNLNRRPGCFCLSTSDPVDLFSQQTTSTEPILSGDHDPSALGIDVRDI